MSGDLVRIGLNGPRYSDAASGFISQRSTWLGAPKLKIIMHARSSCPGRIAPASLAASSCGSDNPAAPNTPTCKNSRRFKWLPPQIDASCSAKKSNIIVLPLLLRNHTPIPSLV